MKFLTNTSTDPHFNLAFDQMCLENEALGDEPVFYLWRNRPSVIIGLNQNAYAEVNLDWLRRSGVTLARRVTGGGAVYHDLQNLNYSIVGRHVSSEPFVDVLRKLGLNAELTGRNDIFVGGKKVSGYARRVWHNREIVHGTLMYDVDIDALVNALNVPGSKLETKGIASVRSRVANLKDILPGFESLDALQSAIQEMLSGGDGEIPLGAGWLDSVRKLSEERFSTWEWVYGHSRQVGLGRTAKLNCGTVTVEITLDHGLIERLDFSGDFLGDFPAERLSASLVGIRYEPEVVLDVLRGLDVPSYFFGTSPEDLTELIVG